MPRRSVQVVLINASLGVGLGMALGSAAVAPRLAWGQAAPPAASPAPAPPKAAPKAAPPAASAPLTPPPPAPTTPSRAPVAEVVSRLQQVYEKTQSLKARFNQVLSGPMGKRTASGGVSLKKPGKMRWDYEKPEKKLFLSDGTTLWMYEPEDEQAFRQPLNSSQLPAQVSFLFGRGKLLDEFTITYLDGQNLGQAGDFVLKLVPKTPTTQYRYLVFVVHPTTYLVKETLLYDQQGGSNDIIFTNVEQNPKTGVDDSRFSFTPPPNTRIVAPGGR